MGRMFGALLASLNTLASVWTMFLVALISSDVVGRAVFDQPIPGVPEIVRFSVVGMVWLWMAYTLRAGKHLRTTLVLGALSRRWARVVLTLNSVVGFIMFALTAWLGWFEMVVSWQGGIFEGEHPVRIPVWPVWAILVLGATLTAIQFALDAVRYVRGDLSASELSEVADLPKEVA
jgi:TRAP-type C4-dicarboxylate transport system permease small subunit